MNPQLKVQDTPEYVPTGLKDGGHTYVRCSNCNAILLDIWRTMPDAINPCTGKTFEWKIMANCPFCGDHSFITEVSGVFHAGGMGHKVEDNEDDDIPSTSFDPPEIIDNVYHFKVFKANEDARPVYSHN